jgi:predicted SprT family Zn-dependent metalloprotease
MNAFRTQYTKVLASELMRKHGLIGIGWRFALDRAKTRAGLCDFELKVISLSKFYVQESYVPLADIRNTILHEIAHALAGDRAGHGRVWKKKALEIGCDGKTYNYVWRGVPKKFRIHCDCGKTNLRRHRVSPKYKRDVCGACRTMHISFLRPGKM